MSDTNKRRQDGDTAPGDELKGEHEFAGDLTSYFIGLALAALLTAFSFLLPRSGLVWAPGIPVALIVFAIAQMGVHLVFFLHITTGPDNTNNALALGFGLLIVVLVIGGSLWIMTNLNRNMMPAHHAPQMQMQP